MSESQGVLFDDDDFIGHCSVPKHENYCLNIGPAHWMACDKCRIKWLIGANLFSSWRYQNVDIWMANEKKLRKYREIDIRTTSASKHGSSD